MNAAETKTDNDSSSIFYKPLFENHSAIMILVDKSGQIIDVNDAAVKFYGYSNEEFKKMHNYDFNTVPKDELIEYTRQAYNKERNYFTCIHKLKNGELRTVEVHISPISVNGKTFLFSIIHDITENIDLAKKIKESEELFRTLTENMTMGLVLYKEKIIYINPAGEKILGYSENELKNMYVWDIYVNEFKEEAKKGIHKGLSDINYNHYVTFKAIKKSGEEIWLYIYGSSVIYKNEIVRIASFVDITEMVNMRNQIESDKELFKTLIENMPIPVGIYNEKLLFANPAAEKLFGYDKEEFYNKYVWEFFDENDKKFNKIKKSFGKIKNKEKFISKYIIRCKKKDGSIIYANFFEMSIVYNGDIAGFGVIHDITDEVLEKKLISEEKEAYKELSEIDELTKIGNRRAFDKKLEELLNASGRYGRALSLIMFDIDKFKDVNDGFGHEIGDYILKEITKLIKRNLRNTDYFFRYGGEEFMIISPETPLSTAKELAERLRLKIEEHDFNIGTSLTCSFGITEAVKGDTNISIVFRVDGALYNAKNTGRNKISWE
jgi:diguanylate cyclase (GGDEF)-like protein/PAS domain S-box-containing protein